MDCVTHVRDDIRAPPSMDMLKSARRGLATFETKIEWQSHPGGHFFGFHSIQVATQGSWRCCFRESSKLVSQ
eukprot:scaffold7052_cov254-Pinguiococcus_pyrenoidosus.AAC.24